MAQSAHAVNIFVQSTADSGGTCPGATCTLRQAIAQATPFDAVRFSLPAGSTITLLTPISVTTQVTVFGPGAGNLAITANHTAPGTSGGELFYVTTTGDIGISDLTLQGASTYGSLPLVGQSGGYLTIVRCVLRNAYYSGWGGAVRVYGGSLDIEDSSLSNNRSYGGGAVYVGLGLATILRTTFSNNYASGEGGAIEVDLGAGLTVADSTFSGNSVGDINNFGYGGAIDVNYLYADSATISGSTFVGNSSTDAGGAISSGGNLAVTNSTFVQNSASMGGAILTHYTAGLSAAHPVTTLKHVTVAGNSAGFGGGLYATSGATVNVQNSILSKNPLSGGGYEEAYGTFTTQQYNLVQFPGRSSGWDANFDRQNTDPLLFALGDYGGQTQTMPAGVGGFVIDEIPTANGCNGANVTVDQRGVARPQSTGCDRGAFEKVPGMTSTVTYNSNGGTAVPSQTVPFNTPTTAPLPPLKTGYAFGGWYSDVGLITAFVFTTPITANITLYAKWTINNYTVTFNSNGGSAVASQSVPYNTTATTPAPPTKAGSTFAGWYSDVGLTTPFVFTTPIVANITLNAKWTISATAPTLQGAASRRGHGAAGTFDLALSLVVPPAINHSPTTEPRTGPAQTIVFTFNKPIAGATATVTEGNATAGAPTFSGNNVVVALSNVTNQQYVTVSLGNVASTDGGTGGSGSVRVGFLAGDANQSRVVTVADLGLVNVQLSQPVTAANYLMDVNTTGTLTVADKGITNANLTKALPTP